jgi:hypothetical protein
MRLLITISALLLAGALYQESAQSQEQKGGDAGKKTNSEIRPLPPTSAPPPLPPTATNTSDRPITTPNKNSEQKYNQWDHLSVFLTALATVLIAFFTWLTWRVYEAQLKAMKINARAWVVPMINPIEPTKDPTKFQVRVELRNTGETPAWMIEAGSRGKGATKQEPLPITPSYDKMGPFTEKGTLLTPTGSLTHGFSLEKERLDHVHAEKSQLFIFGYAKYRDVYGDPHIVRYCFEAKKSNDANHPHPLEFYVSGPPDYWEAD